MAHIGGDEYLTAWVPGRVGDDLLAEKSFLLLGDDSNSEEASEGVAAEPSRGFIIQDWFGPFLLGPASRFLRGRC